MAPKREITDQRVRLGEAAAQLGVSPETVRRWVDRGRLRGFRTEGGQRTVRQADLTRLMAERRRTGDERPIVGQSARNRFPGVVTAVRKDTAAAVVEVQSGPHRLVSLLTREAVDELGLSQARPWFVSSSPRT
jgi:molybdopterin-binding protein